MEIVECKDPFERLGALGPLFAEHYCEVTVAKDVQAFDPDLLQYEAFHRAGDLVVLLLMDGEKIAGYCVAIFYRTLHWHVTACHVDLFYVDPSARGKMGGMRMKKNDIRFPLISR